MIHLTDTCTLTSVHFSFFPEIWSIKIYKKKISIL